MALQFGLLATRGLGSVGWLAAVGSALTLVALLMLVVPVRQFKRSGGVARGDIFANTTVVVDSGLFAVARHPQFLAMVLIALGVAFLGQRWDVVAAGVAATCAFMVDFTRADRREVAKFGQPYVDYMRRVPGWNPIVGFWRLIAARKR